MTSRILATTIALLLTPSLFAVTDTWDGGGADNNFATGLNWADNTAPLSDLVNTDLVFGGTVRPSPNVGSAFSTNSITFNNTAGAFTFGGAGITVGAGGIVNNDASAQTFTNTVNIGTATSLFNAASGALTFNGTVFHGPNALTLSGGSTITFGGSLSGVGLITKTSAAPLIFNATSAEIFADFNLNAGATTLAATGTTQIFSLGSTLAINGTATLALNENAVLDSLSAQLTRASGGGLTIAAGKTLRLQNGADANITGDFTNSTGSTVVVNGTGSTFQTTTGGFMSFLGGSTLAVQSGGSVISASSVNIGAGSSGTLTVDGAGSTVSAAANSFWGSGAQTANVTFSNAATGSFLGLAIATGSSTGVVQVLTGADVNNGTSLTLANNTTGGNGTLTVSGAGSTWTQAGPIILGSASGSVATLNVQNGGVFNTGTGMTTVNETAHLNITGGTFNANGSVTLNGDGAQLNSTSFGVFNLAGGNSLTVQGGADALITNAYQQTVRANLFVGGAGSTFTTGGDFQWEGAGNTLSLLNVSGGGLLSSGGALHLGRNNTAVTFTVDGAGSQLMGNTASTSEWQASVQLINGASATLGALRIADTVAFSTSSGSLDVRSGSTASIGSLTAGSASGQATASISVSGIGSAITQSGTSTLTLGAAFSNTASLSVTNSGTFTSGTGAFTLNATGTVNVNGGTATFNGPLTNNGGTMNFTSGTLNLLGTNNLTIGTGGNLGTSLTLTSDQRLALGTLGTTTIDAARTLTLAGGSLTTGALVNNGTFDFQRGTLGITGAGGFNVGTGALGGNVTLGAGANLQVTNTTTIAGGALLRVNGGSFSGSNVTNDGTIDHRDGTFNFTGALANKSAGRIFVSGLASPAGTIANAGTITLQNGIGFLGGTGAITNTGLITGDGTIAKPVANNAAGQIRAESGKTLTFTGAMSSNAGAMSLQGGTLEFTSAIANGSTGFISGHGALRTAGLTNQGLVAISGGNADIFGDVTNAAGARIVTSGGATTTFFDDVVHNGIEIRTSAGGASVFFGAVSGAGPYTGTGTVYFEGDLRPGNSPALVTFGGDVVYGTFATVVMELGGTIRGTEYDAYNVAGTLTFGGTLNLVLFGGFTPEFGDAFDLFDASAFAGDFHTISAPALPGGNAWDFTNLKTTGTVTVVPEPGIGALLASALTLLGLRRRRAQGAAVETCRSLGHRAALSIT